MAGDWIKMRIDLQDDPAVVAICNTLELDEFQVIGRLHKLWGWADKHTADGVTSGVTPKWVDRYINQSGFAESLMQVGWLTFEDGILRFPGFDIHNGKSAKSRCDAALRQRVSRGRHDGVTNGGDKRVTIPKPFVRAVFSRDNYTCVYCGFESSVEKEAGRKSVLSVDHIVPHSRGSGRQAIEDLATCCKACNREKNDRTPEEWGLLPTFLQDGVEYLDHMLVTQKCDNAVTKALPEKRREEYIEEEREKTFFPPSIEVIELWNKTFSQKCDLTQSRARALGARMKSPKWVASFQEAIERASKSRFCRGENDRGWKADLDWFLKPDTVTKILEGKYDNRQAESKESNLYDEYPEL